MRLRLAGAAVLIGFIACVTGCKTPAPNMNGHWLQANGHAIYYETSGKLDGSPVLLLHGGGSSIHGSFRHQIKVLGAEHFVIGIEQVGQGHTPDVPGPLSYSKMADDTASVLQQLRLRKVDAIGYSDGGIIALMLASRHPRLVRRLVVSGANIDPGGLNPEDIAEMEDDAPDDDGSGSDPAIDDAVTKGPEAVGNPGAETADNTPIGEKLRQLWLYSPKPDELNLDLLRDIKQRTLVMAGEHDAVRLAHTKLIAETLPHARLWILPDTGHSTFSSRPKLVNAQVLSFLDEP